VRYKDIGNVYCPGAAKRRPLRLLMVAQPHHTAKGTTAQAPCFDQDTYHVITTDLQRPAHEIIQAAFDRWQIVEIQINPDALCPWDKKPDIEGIIRAAAA
jgi:hypothetical protein